MIVSPESYTGGASPRLGTSRQDQKRGKIMYTAAELRKLGIYVKGVTQPPRTRVVESTRNGQVVVRPVKMAWVSL
jgi:hypothetical protein